jgi:glycine hydroxymethyltransferase
VTSGVRIGTPAITTRGFVESDMKAVADIITCVAKGDYNKDNVKQVVQNLCSKYPIYIGK